MLKYDHIMKFFHRRQIRRAINKVVFSPLLESTQEKYILILLKLKRNGFDEI